jgi:hypothetical protein
VRGRIPQVRGSTKPGMACSELKDHTVKCGGVYESQHHISVRAVEAGQLTEGFAPCSCGSLFDSSVWRGCVSPSSAAEFSR